MLEEIFGCLEIPEMLSLESTCRTLCAATKRSVYFTSFVKRRYAVSYDVFKSSQTHSHCLHVTQSHHLLSMLAIHRYVGAELLSNLSDVARPLTQSITESSFSSSGAGQLSRNSSDHPPEAAALAGGTSVVSSSLTGDAKRSGRTFSLLKKCVGASSTDRGT